MIPVVGGRQNAIMQIMTHAAIRNSTAPRGTIVRPNAGITHGQLKQPSIVPGQTALGSFCSKDRPKNFQRRTAFIPKPAVDAFARNASPPSDLCPGFLEQVGHNEIDRFHGAICVTKMVTMSSGDNVTSLVHDFVSKDATINTMSILTPPAGQTFMQEEPLEFGTALGARLAKLRKTKAVTQLDLASALDVSRETIARWELGIRSPKNEMVAALASFFQVPESWLRYGGAGGPKTIQVMGYVGAGAGVLPFEDGPFDQIEAPFGAPPNTIALIVRGDSMMPELGDGDYVLYKGEPQSPEDLIGKRCIIQLEDGRILVKRLRRGRDFGRFDLDSTNAATLENQIVVWCAKVEAVKYR